MMIRVNGEYLDFNDDIEIESQVKLFEEISTSNGDFSYSFDLPTTSKNLKALGLPFPDTVKSIYNNVLCDIIDNSGFVIYTGSLQVNKLSTSIQCTFFGGNNNWFALLNDPLSSLPLDKYDTQIDSASIIASWSADKGLVYPLIDAGVLITRSYSSVKVEDFVPCFYVKTLFKEIFNPLGIKVNGDLINDSTFNQLVVAANGRSVDGVIARSCYVKKTSTQNLSGLNPAIRIFFEEQSIYPYFDGSLNNCDAQGLYTADIKMRVRLDVSLILSAACETFYITVRVNGVVGEASYNVYVCTQLTWTKSILVDLEEGDTLSVFGLPQAFPVGTVGVSGGTFKVTPTYLYKSFGKDSVPKWTQLDFVSNILRIFNVVPYYESTSKTLTLNLFNKIKDKEEIDVSDNVEIVETDFSEFISNYAKDNVFSYQEGNDEDLRTYNISNFVQYGSGTISVNNDFVEQSADVVQSDFTSPVTYLNGVFDMSIERINFVELDEDVDVSITAVTSVSLNVARFAISNADDYFTAGDLVRIETDLDTYNGDWVVNAVTSSYITVEGGVFDANTTGTAILLRHQFTTDSGVYLFANIPNIDFADFSSIQGVTIDASTSTLTTIGIAYFNMLNNQKRVNNTPKLSLYFGTVNNPLSYQLTILDTYWPVFERILNDPVKLLVSAYFDQKTFGEIKTFLQPLRIKTNRTNNLYYLNRITGYKSGHEACEGELIKL